MPAFGGLSPYPRRCGGGTPRLEIIRDSFASQLGSAYATSDTSVVAARNAAVARMLSAAWGTNVRLGNIADPYRMHPSLIQRWEQNILKIVPPHDASETSRRDEIQRRTDAIGKIPSRTRVRDELEATCGAAFVELYYIPNNYAVIHTRETGYPWGSVVENPHGVFGESCPWYSTVAHILALIVKPDAMTEGEFRQLMGLAVKRLDPILPAYTTFSWYRAPAVGTPVDVPDGPQQTGMYLDEPNLDNLVFAPFPHPGVPGFFLDVPEGNLNRLEFA